MLTLGTANSSATTEQQLAKQLTEARQEAADNKQLANNLKIALIALTGVYIFVYIMGRRRLTRMIWVRNRAIRIALKKAEESDHMKSEFIREMSHQVRTPLNTISGFSQLLCNEEFQLNNEERNEIKERIEENVEQITAMINQLHDMATKEGEEKV